MKPSKESVEAAIRDSLRDGHLTDAEELASDFGLTVEEIEEILEQESK